MRYVNSYIAVLIGLLLWPVQGMTAAPDAAPNVIVILTDDHGYGDLGCHGNKYLKTVAIDRLYSQSVRLTNYHVDPTGAATRAALLTGRYACRSGVWHTMMGRSLLRRDERTLADLFAEAGYRTAVFGKWHLGDNYPYRAVDRGFHESLVHGGGGIGQTPDYWGNTYFDPVLSHNGKPERQKGYCTDVFFAGAIDFIAKNRTQPFLICLTPNVPHSPYQVPDAYTAQYVKMGIKEPLAQYCGMITNLDQNMARLLKQLDEWGLADNTIILFTTDNGTTGRAIDVQLKGAKGSAYDAGHRVPCFFRWPAKLKGGFDVDQLSAHVDILPTLLGMCEIHWPERLILDGRSLIPLLVRLEDWAPRTMFVQSHGMEHPQQWLKSAVMTEQYRLIDGRELYDMEKDPSQSYNTAFENPKVVDKLRFAYEEWYKGVSTRFDETSELVLGSPKQNPTQLSCFDWHAPAVPYLQEHIRRRVQANGYWAIETERAGRYRFTLREQPAVARFPLRPGVARLKIATLMLVKTIEPGATGVDFFVNLKAGKTRLQTWLLETGGGVRGAYFVEVEYLGPAEG